MKYVNRKLTDVAREVMRSPRYRAVKVADARYRLAKAYAALRQCQDKFEDETLSTTAFNKLRSECEYLKNDVKFFDLALEFAERHEQTT